MMKGDFSEVRKMKENKRRQYASLFNVACKLMNKRCYRKKKLFYIMQFAVLEPAPEFFVDWRSFQKIFQCVQDGHFKNSPKWYDQEKAKIENFEPQDKHEFKTRTYDRQER